MTEVTKIPQGTEAWFEMAGALMSEAVLRAGFASDFDVSLVERYTDGGELSAGLVQGLRLDIRGGKPSFQVGVGRDERADVTVEMSAAAARKLNSLRTSDPDYGSTRASFVTSGEARIDGDLSRLGDWLEAVHDPIVERTL